MSPAGTLALSLSDRADRDALAVMGLFLSAIFTLAVWSWLKTTAGAVKTAFAAGVAAIAGLVSFEIEPVLGLVLLVAFEAATDYAIGRHGGVTRRERASRVLHARAWLLFACGAAVVFANASPPTVEASVKAALVLIVGGMCLIVGWYRIGTRAPIIALMADVMVQRLRGKGVDLSLVDEEGKNLHVAARIREVAVGPHQGYPIDPPLPADPET